MLEPSIQAALAHGKIKPEHPWLRRAAILASLILAGLLLGIVVFRFVGAPISPVMIAEKLRGNTLTRNWVPLTNISRELPLAVIASEDGSFCKHWGVEWRAVRDAIREGKGVRAGLRGASTITMQLAKNLYLWPQRSYTRKMYLSQYCALGAWHLWCGGRKPTFLSQTRGRTHPPRGNLAREGATESQSLQSG
jgi:hypothetical protein